MVRQVGVPAQGRKTSPILGMYEGDEDTLSAAAMPEVEVCFFNDEEFQPGSEVQSEDALLRCEGGSWVATESPAEQPS